MSTKTAPRTKLKKQLLVDLLKRKTGASINDIGTALGWQPHTIRAAISGLRKSGFSVDRETTDKGNRYRVTADPAQ